MGSRVRVPAETDGRSKDSFIESMWKAEADLQASGQGEEPGTETAGSHYHPWAYWRRGIRFSRARGHRPEEGPSTWGLGREGTALQRWPDGPELLLTLPCPSSLSPLPASISLHLPCIHAAAAAAAKLLQSCPTLCYPIDGSPLGSALPGILQARTLEYVTISFSNTLR